MGCYLITGGAGFIGSALAHRLIDTGHEVIILDNLLSGNINNIPKKAHFIKCDVSKILSFKLIPKLKFTAVIHMAAQSSGEIGQKNPYNDMLINSGSTLLISRWCLDKGIKKLIFTSSMTVYGSKNIIPLDEEYPCNPIGYYGISKLASEKFCYVASLEGLSTTALRLYNVYGPNQNLKNIKQGMMSIYLAYLLVNKKVPVTGSLNRFRDFVYIDDVVLAIENILFRKNLKSLVYNIGSGEKITVKTLLNQLLLSMNLPNDYPIEELNGSINDVFGSVANISRAKLELGWVPKTNLIDGVDKMVDWAKNLNLKSF